MTCFNSEIQPVMQVHESCKLDVEETARSFPSLLSPSVPLLAARLFVPILFNSWLHRTWTMTSNNEQMLWSSSGHPWTSNRHATIRSVLDGEAKDLINQCDINGSCELLLTIAISFTFLVTAAAALSTKAREGGSTA
jgi:hypothetical protein